MVVTMDHLLWALGALGSSLLALFALGRILLGQVERRLDQRFASLEKIREEASRAWRDSFVTLEAAYRGIDQQLRQLQIDLPLQYQRREDAIRQEVGIIHRLDALSEKVADALRCDHGGCPLRQDSEIRSSHVSTV